MNELIKVTEKDGKQLVSARDLHEFLETKEEFRKWIPRMLDYGFVEGGDFTPTSIYINNQQALEYALTLDCAKEISMLQRTIKGKQARLYFIECEKVLLSQKPKLPTHLETAKQLVSALTEVERLTPIAAIAEALTDTSREYGMSEVAKIMETTDINGKLMGRNKFYKALRIGKILRDDNEPYQKYIDQGYFKYKTNLINDMFINTTYVTGKGLAWLQHNRDKVFGRI